MESCLYTASMNGLRIVLFTSIFSQSMALLPVHLSNLPSSHLGVLVSLVSSLLDLCQLYHPTKHLSYYHLKLLADHLTIFLSRFLVIALSIHHVVFTSWWFELSFI